ncbi:MAG: SdiA-regulated domain-containing protein [bacterium]
MKILNRNSIILKIFIMTLFLLVMVTTSKLVFKYGTIIDNLQSIQIEDINFPYDLHNPSNKFKLPHELDEISGLSYLRQNELVCIQDEKEAVYVFDIAKEKIINACKYGKSGDCEDVAVVKNTIYVLESNGHIYEIEKFEKKNHRVKRYKALVLSKENNTEGLAFDEGSYSLLITCKGSQEIEEQDVNLRGKKAIYRFDLNTKKISPKPAYAINVKNMGGGTFQPSGIAVHPITRQIYMISSVDKTLLALNQQGKIIAVEKLNRKIFKQPEGICFNSHGDLFISNESRDDGKANILEFKYKQ